MSNFSSLLDLDDIVVRCRNPHPPYRRSAVCLACLHLDGRFELLSDAWERLLGFTPAELDGRSIFTLLPPGRAGRRALRRLIDMRQPEPLSLSLHCKDTSAVTLQLYRRFDPYDGSIFVAGTSPERALTPSRYPASHARTHP